MENNEEKLVLTDLNPNNRPLSTVQRENIYKPIIAEEKKIVLFMKDVEASKKPFEEPDDSVDLIEVNYVIEYLTPIERINFVNDVHRILKKNAKITIVTSHWAANKTYGNIAEIQWPPVAEAWFMNLNKKHRENVKLTETRYMCDFDAVWGYGMHPAIVTRNQEYQQEALTFWREAPQDLIVTLLKK